MCSFFVASIVSFMVNYLNDYQQSLKAIVSEGFEIVDYARKSISKEELGNRSKFLQKMVDNLKNRSFATKVFVSTCSSSCTPFSERHHDGDFSLHDIKDVDGNTNGKKNIYENTSRLYSQWF